MKNIKMGNDEFILYIRKQYPDCCLDTKTLGKRIWNWLESNAAGSIKGQKEGCEWGEEANNVASDKLPYTATQFEFDRKYLPALYDELDRLGSIT